MPKMAWVPACQHAILALHFVGLTVASLVYHAKRSREWWRADVAFTMLSLLPFLAAEIMYRLDRAKRKWGCPLQPASRRPQPEQPDSWEEPAHDRSSEEQPGGTRSSQKQPEAARSSQRHPGEARSSQY